MERPSGPLHEEDRVLVVRLGAVGDVIRALPAVHRLRARFPSIHLGWVVEDLSAPLLESQPDLNEVITLQRRDLRRAGRNPKMLAETVGRIRRRLRSSRFTVAVDLQASFKSGLISVVSGAPRRVGFAPGFCREMSFLFTTEWVPVSSPWLNRVDRNLEMARALGATEDRPGPPNPTSPLLVERVEEGRVADELLASFRLSGMPLVVLAPGASRRQSFKMWPAHSFARLSSLMHRAQGISPVVLWGPGEERLADQVVRESGGSAIKASPTSLPVLAAILRRAAVFVGADSGPMHLAWSVGCPVVALFGPTDPRLNAPCGAGHAVLRATTGAMEDIAPEAVHEAVSRALVKLPGSFPKDGSQWGSPGVSGTGGRA